MDTIYVRMDPQRVPAAAMAVLPQAEREQIMYCQQAFYPLPGALVEKIRQAVERKEKSNGR